MSINHRYLKEIPTVSIIPKCIQSTSNNYRVEITDSSSPGTKIDMFADINYTDDGFALTDEEDFNYPIEPILKKLEHVFAEKLNLDAKEWTAPLIPLVKTVRELYKKALESDSNSDIRKFNVANNSYLVKLKRMRQFMTQCELNLATLENLPKFPNWKRKKAVQRIDNNYIPEEQVNTNIILCTQPNKKILKDKKVEAKNKPSTQPKKKILKDKKVEAKNKPSTQPKKKILKEAVSCPVTPAAQLPAYTFAPKAPAKTTITRTFTTINPQAKTRTLKTVPTAIATLNSFTPVISQSVDMANKTPNKVHPQPGPVAGGPAGGGGVPTFRPAGIPRAFLQPDHPLSVNYINMQASMENNAIEFHQVQTEQYNTEESFIGDQHENSQDSNPESTEVPEPGGGQKRGRAFDRLGPITQPKKPKLTINLMFSKEQSVREVIDVEDDEQPSQPPPPPPHVAVPDRDDVINSLNPVVLKYRHQWPWNMVFSLEKTAMPRNSKSVMIMEAEQMMEAYERGNKYVKISISGYPPHFTQEDVLDLILENVKDKHFVPIFIDFKPTECQFLVLRARAALNFLHRKNLVITQDKIEMGLSVSTTDLGLDTITFIPKQVLKTILTDRMIEDISLDLREFCLQSDIINFIYYPLKRLQNQFELMELNTKNGIWCNLRELNLSHNKLMTVEGFNFPKFTPHLQYLDLSFNCLVKMTNLLCCKGLNLRALKLEGNPLCGEYIDPDHYVKVARMIFPRLREFDGILVPRLGEMPDTKQNYCPPSAKHIAEKFIETFFPLLDQTPEERTSMEQLYSENAFLTITFRYRLRYGSTFKYFRELFSRSRCLEENEMDAINGAKHIVKQFTKWPEIQHDPHMTTVDVMSHEDNTTILRIGGVIRLASSSLEEDKHMLAFSRTVVLHSKRGAMYKIYNEMLQWDEVSEELAKKAFQNSVVKPPEITLDMETEPDNVMKEGLVKIFMEITRLNQHQTERCLKLKSWNFKDAMEYFIKLVKLGSTDILDLTGN